MWLALNTGITVNLIQAGIWNRACTFSLSFCFCELLWDYVKRTELACWRLVYVRNPWTIAESTSWDDTRSECPRLTQTGNTNIHIGTAKIYLVLPSQSPVNIYQSQTHTHTHICCCCFVPWIFNCLLQSFSFEVLESLLNFSSPFSTWNQLINQFFTFSVTWCFFLFKLSFSLI